MKWLRRGLIVRPSGCAWARHSALQPTPHLRVRDAIVRIFAGFRDDDGVSRVGFVDVSALDPSTTLGVSPEPVLEVGRPGTFDESGVVPCAISDRGGRLYMFYAGYQRGQKVKFYVFSGLAISDDGGQTFQRYSEAPVCDRTDSELYFRVIHTMMHDGGVWRAWYGGGSAFDVENGKQYPRYDIRYAESPDGIHLAGTFRVCLEPDASEYRLGRPFVVKDGAIYRMFCGASTRTQAYRLAYAESSDGLTWARQDADLGLDACAAGWDSEMQAYPSLVTHAGRTYLFYNGNDYGREGFGYAELERW
jgi:hypothetical protein